MTYSRSCPLTCSRQRRAAASLSTSRSEFCAHWAAPRNVTTTRVAELAKETTEKAAGGKSEAVKPGVSQALAVEMGSWASSLMIVPQARAAVGTGVMADSKSRRRARTWTRQSRGYSSRACRPHRTQFPSRRVWSTDSWAMVVGAVGRHGKLVGILAGVAVVIVGHAFCVVCYLPALGKDRHQRRGWW